MYSITNLTFIW